MPTLLDTFSGIGGAGVGYARAGFEVLGVDSNPNVGKYYPFEFVVADALEYVAAHGAEFDLIHASPPCQRYTHGNVGSGAAGNHPDLVGPTRDALRATGRPYIIENVPRSPLLEPITLCGSMFGLTAVDDDGELLRLRRHRWFESPLDLYPPRPCDHPAGAQWAGAYGGARHDKREARHVRHGGYVPRREVQAALLGIGWPTTAKGLTESIPPAYTEWLGLLATVPVL